MYFSFDKTSILHSQSDVNEEVTAAAGDKRCRRWGKDDSNLVVVSAHCQYETAISATT